MYKLTLPPSFTARPCAFCLAIIGLLPRSLLSPAALPNEPVSVTSSPVFFHHFAYLDVAITPDYPCGCHLLGDILPLPSPWPPSPRASGLNLQPGPCQSQGVSCLKSLESFPPPSCFFLTRSCAALFPTVLWCFFSSSWRPFCTYKRPGPLHSLEIVYPRPRPLTNHPYQRRSGRPYRPTSPQPPPPILLIPYPSVLVGRDIIVQKWILLTL